jgi:hypothetical protein
MQSPPCAAAAGQRPHPVLALQAEQAQLGLWVHGLTPRGPASLPPQIPATDADTGIKDEVVQAVAEVLRGSKELQVTEEGFQVKRTKVGAPRQAAAATARSRPGTLASPLGGPLRSRSATDPPLHALLQHQAARCAAACVRACRWAGESAEGAGARGCLHAASP